MAKYTAHNNKTLCNTAEEAATALETMIHLVDVTRLNLSSGITKTEQNKFLAWIVYTDEA
jgi:hypothetical protein